MFIVYFKDGNIGSYYEIFIEDDAITTYNNKGMEEYMCELSSVLKIITVHGYVVWQNESDRIDSVLKLKERACQCLN